MIKSKNQKQERKNPRKICNVEKRNTRTTESGSIQIDQSSVTSNVSIRMSAFGNAHTTNYVDRNTLRVQYRNPEYGDLFAQHVQLNRGFQAETSEAFMYCSIFA